MFKNKYTAIIKVKKQGLDNAEMALGKAKAMHEKALMAIKEATSLYRSMGVRNTGFIKAARADLELKEIARQDILLKTEQELVAKREFSLKQALYQKALQDFEKMKYLELEELKKHKKWLQDQEAKFLDEIAISRHFKTKEL